MEASFLPTPHLAKRTINSIPLFTDDALFDASSVRIAFTGRGGGESEGAYAGLNLGTHVDDAREVVLGNRAALLRAFGAVDMPLVVPNQVHGTEIVEVPSSDAPSVEYAQQLAQKGADSLVVSAEDVAALLCFADCVPIIIVSPTGRFAVAHAGWRGAVARIASLTARRLHALDDAAGVLSDIAGFNAYIGPHICAKCFEVSPDIAKRFEGEFGRDCIPDERHVDLERALRCDLASVGMDDARIVSAGACTKCAPDEFFSYRASGGVCGRHGALAFRSKE